MQLQSRGFFFPCDGGMDRRALEVTYPASTGAAKSRTQATARERTQAGVLGSAYPSQVRAARGRSPASREGADQQNSRKSRRMTITRGLKALRVTLLLEMLLPPLLRMGGSVRGLNTRLLSPPPVTGPKFERGGVRGRGWHRSYSRSKGQKKAERARAFSACFRRTIEI